MRFPLAEWIDRHSAAPHNLGPSGMRGSLRTTSRALRHAPRAEPTEVIQGLASLLEVSPRSVILTHGATESDALVLGHLFQHLRRTRNRAPRFRWRPPDYPVFPDAARLLGARVGTRGPADVTAVSRPNNPTGLSPRDDGSGEDGWPSREWLLVDETFREFTSDRSVARHRHPNVWVTGTFTKTYGADEVRVGYVVVPPGEIRAFELRHSLLADGIASSSIDAAASLLHHRTEILRESRRLFEKNVAYLRRRVHEVRPLAAPLWFDRGTRGIDGDRLVSAALKEGVLVCPGSFFGDPTGVRVALTRRTFPADLQAYLRVRGRFVL